jgi:carotenoid cleavage dioxygenase-like enzyme
VRHSVPIRILSDRVTSGTSRCQFVDTCGYQHDNQGRRLLRRSAAMSRPPHTRKRRWSALKQVKAGRVVTDVWPASAQ